MELLGSITWDRFFHIPSEDLEIPEKIQRLRPSLNPRTRVLEASMLTARPPKPPSVKAKNEQTYTPTLPYAFLPCS